MECRNNRDYVVSHLSGFAAEAEGPWFGPRSSDRSLIQVEVMGEKILQPVEEDEREQDWCPQQWKWSFLLLGREKCV